MVDTILSMKEIFSKVEKTTGEVGLNVEEDKAEYMCINIMERRDRIGKRWQLSPTILREWSVYNDVTKEIKGRIQSTKQICALKNPKA